MMQKVKYHFVADTGLAVRETCLLCFICLSGFLLTAPLFDFICFFFWNLSLG